MLIADASAYSPGFSQDRGIGAATGAARQLANKVIAELFDSTRKLHPRTEGLQLHDLTLPRAFRIGGSFGTNWMMPTVVRVSDPSFPPGPSSEPLFMATDQIKRAFAQIFASQRQPDDWPQVLETWTRDDDPNVVFQALLGG